MLRAKCILATMDNRSSNFSFSSASNYYASTSYLTEEEILEDIHPCAFISIVQTREQDNPTYKYVLRGTKEERYL